MTTISGKKIMEEMKLLMTEMFKKHEDTITKMISSNTATNNETMEKLAKEITKTNKKIDSIYEIYKDVKKEIDEIKLSLEVCQEIQEQKMRKIERTVMSNTSELKVLKHSYEKFTQEVNHQYINEKLREIEDRSRRNNLRIDGVKESEGETWAECEEKVCELFQRRLNVTDVVVEGAYRTGKMKDSSGRKPRTIVLKVLNYKDKTKILSNGKKLKNSGIFINQDFSELRAQMLAKREKGKYCIISYDKLIIRDFKHKRSVMQK